MKYTFERQGTPNYNNKDNNGRVMPSTYFYTIFLFYDISHTYPLIHSDSTDVLLIERLFYPSFLRGLMLCVVYYAIQCNKGHIAIHYWYAILIT